MAQTIEWSRGFGSPSSQRGSVAIDPLGDLLLTSDRGSLPNEVLLSKFDSTGKHLWTQKLGAVEVHNSSVATDADANIFVSEGLGDLSLFKFDPNGNRLWSTTLSPADYVFNGGIAVDGQQNLYLGGGMVGNSGRPLDTDVFVSKFDNAGSLLWRRELGTNFTEWCTGVSSDANGNVYITGTTQGDLEGDKGGGDDDIFVSKFNSTGDLQWTQQFGLFSDDRSEGISVDGAGNVFVSGFTPDSLGSTNLGGMDAVLMKLDALGDLQWLRQFGTTESDYLYGVAADGHGNAFVTGTTNGSLGGPNGGASDAFVAKFDADGQMTWTLQLGGEGHQSGNEIATDGRGTIAVGIEYYVTKIRDVAVPEPGTLGLSLGFVGLFWNRRRSRAGCGSQVRRGS
jgi:hypothetical protein